MVKHIYNLKRLFLFKKEGSFSLTIKHITGFKPKDIRIYELAFIHKSSSIKTPNGKTINNERLEFLGDAILDAIVADIMYKNYPDRDEGFLTRARAKLVSRHTLNALAEELKLEKHVKSTSTNYNTNIPGNTLEALIGAVYLDQGYHNCKNFVDTKLFRRLHDLKKMVKKDTNYKSILLEWSQKQKHEIAFNMVKEVIDKHNVPTFYCEILIDNELYSEGKGASKKESHQHAANKAIGKLKTQKRF